MWFSFCSTCKQTNTSCNNSTFVHNVKDEQKFMNEESRLYEGLNKLLWILLNTFNESSTVKYLHAEWAAAEGTYQLGDVGHLRHVVQCVLAGFIQHNEAGRHDGQVPQRLHIGVDASVAVCHSEINQGVTDLTKRHRAPSSTGHEADVRLTG